MYVFFFFLKNGERMKKKRIDICDLIMYDLELFNKEFDEKRRRLKEQEKKQRTKNKKQKQEGK